LLGLLFLIVGAVCLDAAANTVLSNYPMPGAVGILPGLIIVRMGLGALCGNDGAYFDDRTQEIVFWKRNLLFIRSVVRCSPDQFDAIRVQKWVQRGFPARLHGYAVTLSSKDKTRKVEWFETKNQAADMAKRLAACCHLAIQADDAEGIPAS
jgi:hypothetical protein